MAPDRRRIAGAACTAVMALGGTAIVLGGSPLARRAPGSPTASGPDSCSPPPPLPSSSAAAVTWSNTPAVPHTASRCTVSACGVDGGTGSDAEPNTPQMSAGSQSAPVTFHGAGTYV